MTATKLAATASVAVLIAGCFVSGPASRPTPTTEPADPGYITRAEYGSDWPFTVAAGTLSCNMSGGANSRPLVTFSAGDGIEYALNGAAIDFGFPELDAMILEDYPSKTGVLPFIDRASPLC